jgi:rfaE bifunctional protein nucleotidyltransferase chain/domain
MTGPRDPITKIVSREEAARIVAQATREGCAVVATNGCFDLLHAGHVTYLSQARALGDLLLVGLNGDASVCALKGPPRPITPEQDRAYLLAALECVDLVVIFPEPTALELIAAIRPPIYVKGGDYTIDTINQDERRLVESYGGRIVILAEVPGASTTDIFERIRAICERPRER